MALAAGTSAAQSLGARLEAGAAVPLSEPQRTAFGPGFSTQLEGLLQVAPVLDVAAQVSWLLLTPGPAGGGPGTALGVGAGLRLKRPLTSNLLVPWAELGVQLAVTGSAKVALQPAAGLQLRFSDASPLWLGLFARLTQIFTLGPLPGYDTFNASVLSAGLSVEYFPAPLPPPPDADGDGVPDERDACREVAAPTADGCPLPLAPKDSDGDGLFDEADVCPREAEDRDGTKDEDGCPDLDDDADGVADGVDECPLVAGPAATKGCPDRDGDGVADRADACPEKAGKAENAGCPTYRENVVTSTKIELRQKIHFAFGKTTILPRSFPLLEEVTQALTDRPSLCVRIEGHTDNKGKAGDNLKLSDGRAAAVASYLGGKGVAPTRLSSKGYGSELPLESNATTEGRELNRRVEFVIVSCP